MTTTFTMKGRTIIGNVWKSWGTFTAESGDTSISSADTGLSKINNFTATDIANSASNSFTNGHSVTFYFDNPGATITGYWEAIGLL